MIIIIIIIIIVGVCWMISYYQANGRCISSKLVHVGTIFKQNWSVVDDKVIHVNWPGFMLDKLQKCWFIRGIGILELVGLVAV